MLLKWLLGLAVLVGLFVGGLLIAGERDDAGHQQGEIVIAATPEQLYPWIIEFDQRRQWITGLERMDWFSGDAIEPGAVRSEWVTIDGDTTEHMVMFMRLQPPTRIELYVAAVDNMTNPASFKFNVIWELGAVDGGTRVRCTRDGEYLSQPARLLEPLLSSMENDQLAENLANLKRVVEAAEG